MVVDGIIFATSGNWVRRVWHTIFWTANAMTLRVKPHRSGRDKRQATLMVYVSADGVDRRKQLIFHRKDNKKVQDEMKQYNSGVTIVWNKEFWCNETVMIRWLRDQGKFGCVCTINYS